MVQAPHCQTEQYYNSYFILEYISLRFLQEDIMKKMLNM